MTIRKFYQCDLESVSNLKRRICSPFRPSHRQVRVCIFATLWVLFCRRGYLQLPSILDGHSRRVALSSKKQPMKLLYIVTSGGKQYESSSHSRFNNKVKSVILENVRSLTTSTKVNPGIPTEWMVDVYLVLGYDIDDTTFRRELQMINPNVGLTVWSQAIPWAYACLEWTSHRYHNPIGIGDKCFSGKSNEASQADAILQIGKAQLARQHRYVVKDMLPYYDFFLALEDDMIIRRHHITFHMEWMAKIRSWTSHAKRLEALAIFNVSMRSVDSSLWTAQNKWQSVPWQQPLTSAQLERLKPGLLRVEVLNGTKTQTEEVISVTNSSYAEQIIDPTLCCGRSTHNDMPHNSVMNDDSRDHLKSTDLVIWETGILGFGVREIPNLESNIENSWVGLMSGPQPSFRPSQYWSGKLLKDPMKRPPSGHPHLIGQSAGWMASQREVMEFHTQHCTGGFLPPFDPPFYVQDGFYQKNVEYWSGGIQLWGGTCNIQRFVSLDRDFSKHLVYHSSNNKQHHTARRRLVLATTLLAQLQQVQRRAMNETKASRE